MFRKTSLHWISITFTPLACTMLLIASQAGELHAEGTSAMPPLRPVAVSFATSPSGGGAMPSPAQPASASSRHPARAIATAIMNVGKTPFASGAASATWHAQRASTPDGSATVVRLATQDLATMLDVPPGKIDVVSVDPVSWSNSSLGDPQPGTLYSQVVTPGYKIVLRTGGQEYVYHSDTGRRVVYCATP